MIFYFTATGNSLYIAKELEAERVSIPKIIHQEDLTFSEKQIGIVCPIHGHEMPQMVKEFIRKATFHTDYLYVVLTYGAFHGGAAELAFDFFKGVRKRVDYINTIIMVDTYLPDFDINKQCEHDKNIETHLEIIKQDIRHRKQEIQKVEKSDRKIHEIWMKYKTEHQENCNIDYFITEQCVGCGICMKVCPGGCIRIVDQKAVHTKGNCQSCMACIHVCPQMAVQLSIKEMNPKSRYRNEHITLAELVEANNQTKQ